MIFPEAGAAAFLPKPFRLAHLAAVSDRVLGRERRAAGQEARPSQRPGLLD
jgi:DNA-binding response OmpR family regulator